jgi:spermidine/putrescine transport system substrate-binding protein
MASLLAACGGGDEEAAAPPAEEAAPAETAPAGEPAAAAGSGGTVSWLSWPGHNDPSFIGPFQDETGITVQGKEYSGGDNMLALATSSPPGTYDVVHADAEYIAQLKDADLLDPMDPADFPEVNDYFPEFGLDSDFPGLVFDGVPYGFIQRFGHLNLAFNTEKVPEADVESYEILWDERVAGKVGWFDWWAHMGPISLYEGAKGSWWPAGELDPYDITAEQFATMTDTVYSLKSQTAGFYSIADIFTAFANEEIWMQPAGGDWTALLLADQGHPIVAKTPKEGTIQWTECLGTMKGAKNPENAKAFIKYAMGARGQVQTAILPAYQASIPSRAGWELMNEEHPDWAERLQLQLDGPNILDFYKSGLVSIRKIPVQQTIEDWNEAWTEFKS